MDELDDRAFDDDELAAALGRRADALTVGVDTDTDAALTTVRREGRRRRRWRAAGSGTLAAAAAVVGVLVLTSVRDDDQFVRTPASEPTATPAPSTVATSVPTVPTTTPPPIVSTPPPSVTSVVTTVPAVPSPSVTSGAVTVPETAPAATQTTASTASPPVAPSTTRYDSVGGSIVVRLAGGAITLDGDPIPGSGYTVRIDDNGPARVRVRFELGDRRSEIRVDLEGGVLVPEITES